MVVELCALGETVEVIALRIESYSVLVLDVVLTCVFLFTVLLFLVTGFFESKSLVFLSSVDSVVDK